MMTSTVPCGIAYNTNEYAGMLCMPQDVGQAADLARSFERHPTLKVIMEITSIPKAWEPLLFTWLFSVIFGFLYFALIQHCITCMLCLGFCVMIMVSGCCGVYFTFIGFGGGADGISGTGDTMYDIAIGIACCVFCAALVCIFVFKRKSIEQAETCIKAACECLWDCPSLLLEPFFALFIKSTLFFIMLFGLVLLFTVGHHATVNTVGDGEPPNTRFSYDKWHWGLIAFYVFCMIWVLELCNSTSQFVVSFGVETWFFSGYNSMKKSKAHPGLTCVSCEAYSIGMRYHFGTLCKGAFLIAVLRFMQVIISIIGEIAGDTGNPVGKCMACCCNCCLECFEKYIAHLNKNAYMDVALNSNDFCTAAAHAVKLLLSNGTTVMVLKGSTWMIELAGAGAIVAGGVWVTFLTVKGMPKFNNPEAVTHIQDPIFICVVAGLVAFVTVLPFMLVFSQAADTVLFCTCVDKVRKQATPQGRLMEGAAAAEGFFGGLFGSSNVPKISAAGESGQPPETQALLAKISGAGAQAQQQSAGGII